MEHKIVMMTPKERLAMAEEIIERGKKYLPLLEEARAKGLIPPPPKDDPTEGRPGR